VVPDRVFISLPPNALPFKPALILNSAVPEALRTFLDSVGRRANNQARWVGICAFLLIVLAGILVLGGLDQLVRFTDNWRWLPWLGLLVAGLVAVWRWAIRPLAARGGVMGSAKLAEKMRPEFHDELSSAVDLAALEQEGKAGGFGGSEALRRRSITRAGGLVREVKSKELLPWRPHLRWFLLLPMAIALVAVTAFFLPTLRVSMARVAFPWLQLGRPGDLQMAFLNPADGDVVAADEPFEIQIEAVGWGRPATLEIDAFGGHKAQRIALQPDLETADVLVGSLLAPPSGDHRVRVKAGKTLTPWASMTVRDRPEVLSYGRGLVLPEYARATDEPFQPDGDDGEIRTLHGTAVSLDLETNTDISAAALQWLGEADEPEGETLAATVKNGRARFDFDLVPGSRSYQIRMTADDGGLIGVTDKQLVEGLDDALPTIEFLTPVSEVTQVEPGLPLELSARAQDDFGLSGIKRTVVVNGQVLDNQSSESSQAGLTAQIDEALSQPDLGISPGDIVSVRLEATDIAGRLGPANERIFVIASAAGKQERERWIKKEAELSKRVTAVTKAAQRAGLTLQEDRPKRGLDPRNDESWQASKARTENMREELDAAKKAAREARSVARTTLEKKEMAAVERELARIDSKYAKPLEKGVSRQQDSNDLRHKAGELEGHASNLAHTLRALVGEDLTATASERAKQARHAAEEARNNQAEGETANQVAAARAEALAETMKELSMESAGLSGGDRQSAGQHAEKLAEMADAVRSNEPEEAEKPEDQLANEVAQADPWLEDRARDMANKARNLRRQLFEPHRTAEKMALNESMDGARKLDSAQGNFASRNGQDASERLESGSDQFAEMAKSASEASVEKGNADPKNAQQANDLSNLAQAIADIADAGERAGNADRAQKVEQAASRMKLADEVSDLADLINELAQSPTQQQMQAREQGGNDPAASAANQSQKHQQQAMAETAREMLEKLRDFAGPARIEQKAAKKLQDLAHNEGKRALDQEKNTGGSSDREALKKLAKQVAAVARELDPIADQARKDLASGLATPADRLEALARKAEDQAGQARDLASESAAQSGETSAQQRQAMQDLADAAQSGEESLERLRDKLVAEANAQNLASPQAREQARAADTASSRLSKELERGTADELLADTPTNPKQSEQLGNLLSAADDQQRRADELRRTAFQMKANAEAASQMATGTEDLPPQLAQEWKRAELLASIEGQQQPPGQSPSSPASPRGQSPSSQGQPQGASPAMSQDAIEAALAAQIAADPLLRAALEGIAADLEDSARQSLEAVTRREQSLAKQLAQPVQSQDAAALAAQQQGLREQAARASDELARASRHQERLENRSWAEALDRAQAAVTKITQGAMQDAASALASGQQSQQAAASSLGQSSEELSSQLAQLEQAKSASRSGAGSTPPGQSSMPLAQAIDQMDASGQSGKASSASGSPSQGQPKPGQSQGQGMGAPKSGSLLPQQASALAQARASSLLGATPARGQGQPGSPMQGQPMAGSPNSSPSASPSSPSSSQSGLAQESKGSSNAVASDGEMPDGLVRQRTDELADADWDALPKRVADGVKQGRRQAVAPEFRDAISSYYKAIADRAKN